MPTKTTTKVAATPKASSFWITLQCGHRRKVTSEVYAAGRAACGRCLTPTGKAAMKRINKNEVAAERAIAATKVASTRKAITAKVNTNGKKAPAATPPVRVRKVSGITFTAGFAGEDEPFITFLADSIDVAKDTIEQAERSEAPRGSTFKWTRRMNKSTLHIINMRGRETKAIVLTEEAPAATPAKRVAANTNGKRPVRNTSGSSREIAKKAPAIRKPVVAPTGKAKPSIRRGRRG